MMGDIGKVRTDKQQLRKMMDAQRMKVSEEQRRNHSERISRLAWEQCLPLAKLSDRPTVFTFMPFRSEVDVTHLMRWCWEAGFRVAVPLIDRARQVMEPREIASLDDVEPGAWGIPEPKSTSLALASPSVINVIIMPGLAFDQHGGRLGYGRGFYDRFLRRYDELGLPQPVKLGVCFQTQMLDELPMEAHDQRVDQVITEEGVFVADR